MNSGGMNLGSGWEMKVTQAITDNPDIDPNSREISTKAVLEMIEGKSFDAKRFKLAKDINPAIDAVLSSDQIANSIKASLIDTVELYSHDIDQISPSAPIAATRRYGSFSVPESPAKDFGSNNPFFKQSNFTEIVSLLVDLAELKDSIQTSYDYFTKDLMMELFSVGIAAAEIDMDIAKLKVKEHQEATFGAMIQISLSAAAVGLTAFSAITSMKGLKDDIQAFKSIQNEGADANKQANKISKAANSIELSEVVEDATPSRAHLSRRDRVELMNRSPAERLRANPTSHGDAPQSTQQVFAEASDGRSISRTQAHNPTVGNSNSSIGTQVSQTDGVRAHSNPTNNQVNASSDPSSVVQADGTPRITPTTEASASRSPRSTRSDDTPESTTRAGGSLRAGFEDHSPPQARPEMSLALEDVPNKKSNRLSDLLKKLRSNSNNIDTLQLELVGIHTGTAGRMVAATGQNVNQIVQVQGKKRRLTGEKDLDRSLDYTKTYKEMLNQEVKNFRNDSENIMGEFTNIIRSIRQAVQDHQRETTRTTNTMRI